MDLDVEDMPRTNVVTPVQPLHHPFRVVGQAMTMIHPVNNKQHVPEHDKLAAVVAKHLHQMPQVPMHEPVLLPTVPNHHPLALPLAPHHSLPMLTQTQQKAGKLLVSALKKHGNTKPKVSKAVSKSKHHMGPSPTKPKPSSLSPSHQIHRTAGPVTLNSPNLSISSGNPNDGQSQIVELPSQNKELATLMNSMHSRQNKRRPRTQECGDQDNPEFTQLQKYQFAEAEDGEKAYNDDDL